MANRRCFQTLTRYFHSIKTPAPLSQILAPTSAHALRQTLTPKLSHHIFENKFNLYPRSTLFSRHFSSRDTDKDEDDDEDDENEEQWESGSEDETAILSAEDKETEAAEIGYKVIGPLQQPDRVFKPYEPVFAVVQIGSHQFKVSNGDCIYTERLKYCDVNDKLILNKVLMLGSKTQTVIGRPILPDAAVHAVVEEHALDAKVIIFKKKRRKNYRRTKGHRQELTKLRITDIQGIEKPEKITPLKTDKKEKLAVGAS
ncbi:50S ribosomal protein L21, mitochondrial [Sesamum alatum]|uniref:Large ribosomal subunit protein bL21m n=1 Tax=Sesamum alatum TaxID=300844 RepID=A0AAE1Z0W2_9LAMI|nr:50S ribosomal protein L21, mitochondrial [Sesamum alatum]